MTFPLGGEAHAGQGDRPGINVGVTGIIVGVTGERDGAAVLPLPFLDLFFFLRSVTDKGAMDSSNRPTVSSVQPVHLPTTANRKTKAREAIKAVTLVRFSGENCSCRARLLVTPPSFVALTIIREEPPSHAPASL